MSFRFGSPASRKDFIRCPVRARRDLSRKRIAGLSAQRLAPARGEEKRPDCCQGRRRGDSARSGRQTKGTWLCPPGCDLVGVASPRNGSLLLVLFFIRRKETGLRISPEEAGPPGLRDGGRQKRVQERAGRGERMAACGCAGPRGWSRGHDTGRLLRPAGVPRGTQACVGSGVTVRYYIRQDTPAPTQPPAGRVSPLISVTRPTSLTRSQTCVKTG